MEVLKSSKSSHSDAYTFVTEGVTTKSGVRKRTHKQCFSPKAGQSAKPTVRPTGKLQMSKHYDFFSSDDEQDSPVTPSKNKSEQFIEASDVKGNSRAVETKEQKSGQSAVKLCKTQAKFQCLTCNKALRNKYCLKLHTMAEHGYAYCECSLSRVSCSGQCQESEMKLAKAWKGKRDRGERCKSCYKLVESGMMDNHVQKYHHLEKSSLHRLESSKCPQCGAELSSKQALLVHLKGHVKHLPIATTDGEQYGNSYQLTLDSKYNPDRARAVKYIFQGAYKMKKQFMVNCNTCGFEPNILDQHEIFRHSHDPYPAIYSCQVCGEKEIAPELIANHTAQHKPDLVAT
ncbi:zinc finger protein 880-like isoform X1 [Watersipora subatra]|uniref:zinc finger protein 880-like isoform X1 n=1 Tax=Watersipora subatra TaxID=2589382 RepID=UPI00355BE8FB